MNRYFDLIFPRNVTNQNGVSVLKITLSTNNETLQLETPEDYSLQITQTGAILSATTVFGALR